MTLVARLFQICRWDFGLWRCRASHACRVGLLGPSLARPLRAFALRGQPAAVQIRSRRICRTRWVLTRPSPSEKLKRPVIMQGGIVRAIHGPDPFALSRCGASLRLSKFAPGKFVEPGGFSPGRQRQKSKTPHEGAFCFSGGEGGIRTHGTLTRTPDFESGTFDHSATSPKRCVWSTRAGNCTHRMTVWQWGRCGLLQGGAPASFARQVVVARVE